MAASGLLTPLIPSHTSSAGLWATRSSTTCDVLGSSMLPTAGHHEALNVRFLHAADRQWLPPRKMGAW